MNADTIRLLVPIDLAPMLAGYLRLAGDPMTSLAECARWNALADQIDGRLAAEQHWTGRLAIAVRDERGPS